MSVDPNRTVTMVPPAPVPLFCDGVIDLSHWELDDARRNGRTPEQELAQAKAAGIVWVIAKASHGKDVVDPSFAPFVEACRSLSLLVSSYHFPTDSAPGNVQADWYLKTLDSAHMNPEECPTMLDRETNDPSPSHTQSYDDACLFVERIHQCTGKYPLLYGNPSYLAPIKSASDPLAKCPLAIAQYGGMVPRVPAAWGSWTLWQHTDGRYTGGGYPSYTPGFGHIDRSVYHGTEAQLRADFATLGVA